MAWAKLPDARSFSKPWPAEVELVCSVFTSLHIALLGFEPFTVVDEWCPWLLAEAALIGTSAIASPRAPMQIPSHLERCVTVSTSGSRASQ